MNGSSLKNRIEVLRWLLPLSLALVALLYQLILARWVHDIFGDAIHFVVEVLFFATAGPLLTFFAVTQIKQWIDIKEQAEAQAKTNERWLASITAASADAILSLDPQGNIDSWNQGAELLFGYTQEEITGRPFTSLLHGEAGREVAWRWLQQAVAQEDFVRGHEATCVDAAGRSFTVELTATHLEESRERGAGMSIIMRDISHRKQREEEIRNLNESLNQQVAARTHELAEKVEELARANSDLQKLDQIRTEFVSLVSHQIRAPLTNMRGAMERMQGDCVTINPTCGRMFAILKSQVLRLDDLVQDVLTSDRLDAGESVLHREPISILPLVKQAVDHMQGREGLLLGRSFVVNEKPGLPLVFADRERLTDVVANLLDNADKYSPPGEEVVVDVRADEEEVIVSVRDFGPGLPPADLERIFNKFYRTDSSDSQAAYGYGLGLYICRRLLESHGGRIWAENHPDGGAVFSFSLPVWEAAHA